MGARVHYECVSCCGVGEVICVLAILLCCVGLFGSC